jgi:predicted nucleotidyltransferase
MENRYFRIVDHEKESTIESLKVCLKNRSDVIFAYLHGSFFTEDRFKDIDIAVYLDPLPPSLLEAELELEAKLSNVVIRYPVDIRILNNASLSFRYNVIKNGQPIVVNNDNIRSDFVEATLSYYFDFSPFLKEYLKEALRSGI